MCECDQCAFIAHRSLEATLAEVPHAAQPPAAAVHLHALQRLAVGVEVQLLRGVGAHCARAAAGGAPLLAACQGGSACKLRGGRSGRVRHHGLHRAARRRLFHMHLQQNAQTLGCRVPLRVLRQPVLEAHRSEPRCWTSRSPFCTMHEQSRLGYDDDPRAATMVACSTCMASLTCTSLPTELPSSGCDQKGRWRSGVGLWKRCQLMHTGQGAASRERPGPPLPLANPLLLALSSRYTLTVKLSLLKICQPIAHTLQVGPRHIGAAEPAYRVHCSCIHRTPTPTAW